MFGTHYCFITTYLSLCFSPIKFKKKNQDVPEAVSAEELERNLDLNDLDERLYMLQSVSAYEGLV